MASKTGKEYAEIWADCVLTGLLLPFVIAIMLATSPFFIIGWLWNTYVDKEGSKKGD